MLMLLYLHTRTNELAGDSPDSVSSNLDQLLSGKQNEHPLVYHYHKHCSARNSVCKYKSISTVTATVQEQWRHTLPFISSVVILSRRSP